MYLPTVAEIDASKARRRHLDFISQTWQSQEPLKIGLHTKLICERLDRAINDYRNGKSTALLIQVPFRHGKSDIVSRYLPPHYLGLFPDNEVFVVSYSGDSAIEFSKSGRRIMRSQEYSKIFPTVKIASDNSSVETWGIEHKGNHTNGKAQYAGLSGTLTSKGYHLGVLDDYCKGRVEAESKTWRDRTWESVTNDFLTRRAPVSITIIMATPWHVDDVAGRVVKLMRENPNAPQFETMRFPARSDEYESGYLFPERFTPQWYTEQFASLGSYGSSALLQCQPTQRTGSMLKVENVQILEPSEFYRATNGLPFARGWDLASSTDATSSNADFTSGARIAVRKYQGMSGAFAYDIFVSDYVRGKWEAPQRNRIIQETANSDGYIPIGVECFGAYKDAFVIVRDALKGLRTVRAIRMSGDKVAKAEALAPTFEAGRVYLCKGAWNQDVIDQWRDFPSGSHDDDVDSLGVAFATLTETQPAYFTDNITIY